MPPKILSQSQIHWKWYKMAEVHGAYYHVRHENILLIDMQVMSMLNVLPPPPPPPQEDTHVSLQHRLLLQNIRLVVQQKDIII